MPATSQPDPLPLGGDALYWRLSEVSSPEQTRRISALYQRLHQARQAGELPVTDIVPSYRGLALYREPDCPLSELRKRAEEFFRASETLELPPGAFHELPVCYNGEDLPALAAAAGLSRPNWIEAHACARYEVAFIGFQPYFPYLLGLPASLAHPRRPQPRPRVPPGSVAIGGEQCGIYPRATPGGWNLVGRCDPLRLSSLQPGDCIRFVPMVEGI